ncbi:MAG: GlsB/YeaQ/YmgE family stress response membrane protein [Egibacteraceae bacterium]
MFSLIGFLIVGLIAGALARFLVPGRDPMGCLGTTLLGLAGSFVGGFLGSLVLNQELDLRASNNFVGSVLGAVIALLVYRRAIGRR